MSLQPRNKKDVDGGEIQREGVLVDRAPTRLGEFIIGRRFAPTRWLGTLPRKREREEKRHYQTTTSRITRRQSISYSRSITGGRAKCQVRPDRVAPRRTNSSVITGWKS